MCTPSFVGASPRCKQSLSSWLKYFAPEACSCTTASFHSHAATTTCSSGQRQIGRSGTIIFDRIGFARFSRSLIHLLLHETQTAFTVVPNDPTLCHDRRGSSSRRPLT